MASDVSEAPEFHQSSRDYMRVFGMFFRNSVVREMTFRGNFIIQVVTRAVWFGAQLTLFGLIYSQIDAINGWSRHQYFAFMATGMLVNAIVETFCMPNCANFSELIRTGNLDFALLKPMDTQFVVSFEKVNLAMLNQALLALVLLGWSLYKIGEPVSLVQVLMFIVFVALAVVFFYSLMISVACTSIWLGRNQSLYDFWFYITVFARYPRSVYTGTRANEIEAGDVLQFAFSYIMPILIVITFPARIIARNLFDWKFAVISIVAASMSLWFSRMIFRRALMSYRSASS